VANIVNHCFRFLQKLRILNQILEYSLSYITVEMSSRLDVLGYFVPTIILSEIFSQLLSLEDICRFDLALCNNLIRPIYMKCIGSESCIWLGDRRRNFNSNVISWLYTRSIKVRHLMCKKITDDAAVKIGSFGSCLHWLSISDINMKRKNVITIIDGCPNLQSFELFGSRNTTDDVIIRLAENCPHLHSLCLGYCHYITDGSIVRLAEIHPNLNSLSLAACIYITNTSIVSIADRCPNLHTLNLQGCTNITDVSVIRIAEACPDLRSLNVSSLCPRTSNENINDISVIRLAESCPKLNSLDLRNCSHITDASIVRLSKGCPDMHTLNLYKCDGVTMKNKELKEIFPNLKYFL
jgi:hypothetical protein